LPKTLDETYERILKEVGKADGDLARQILQCLTAAIRPLSVEELAEILALNFEEAEGDIPKFDQDWRFQGQDLLITCSSLIAIVKDWHSHVVQFSHFSVKEFLTSDRLATPLRDISSFHILPESAHATLAQACLTVLLPFDDNIPDRKIKSNSESPLANYAAKHWVDHAQFEKVSLRVQDGMRRLFDQSRPYFTAWLKLYDIDPQVDPWGLYGKKYPASPLYYASLCGFRDLAEYLVKRPQDVNAVGGRHHSPLAAALHNRHTHVAELLYQHGADIVLAGYSNRTLLVDGHVDAVRWLLEHGANVNFRPQTDSRNPDGFAFLSNGDGTANAAMDHASSPLHLASLHDHFKTMQLLIQRGADVTSRDNLNSTPLHLAALRGGTDSVELLIEHGSDVNARNKENLTPLHLALYRVSAESVQLFTQHEVDVTGQDNSDVVGMLWNARARTVEILIRHGADVHARDEDNSTPLHLASSCGRANAIQLLIQHGADVTAPDKNGSTPLHLASDSYGPTSESIQLLIQHGADVTALDKNDSTPLHLASSRGWTDAMQLLIQHGADVTALDKNDSTPLHLASPYRRTDAMQLLIQHGADVTALDKNDSTPLHLASNSYGTFGSIQLLIQHGADVNARDNRKSTPLHLLAPRWKRGIGLVRLLLEHGADVDATDVNGRTPDEIALSISRSTSGRTSSASTEIARLIQDYRNRVR
jgi:ankyrin repeat protein